MSKLHPISAAALRRLSAVKNKRLKLVMSRLLAHVHAFVQETRLSEEEWFAAIRFLTETGQMCDDKRQEFILLSDTMGVSMLVDAIHHARPGGATESTVLGPFYVPGAQFMPYGANISRGRGGEPTVVSGRVLSTSGKPLRGAVLDVWQTAPNGMYDVQDPAQPSMNLRGRFRTDAQGRFEFRTVKPVSYPIPTDGPVGKLLKKLSRHPYRPAHIHFKVSAKGHAPVTTHLFVRGDKYLPSDVVFGVKPSLVVDFKRHTAPGEAARLKVRAPFYTLRHDFALKPARRPSR
jgi:protocatechuate 3,4-dioxygenase beta subunit